MKLCSRCSNPAKHNHAYCERHYKEYFTARNRNQRLGLSARCKECGELFKPDEFHEVYCAACEGVIAAKIEACEPASMEPWEARDYDYDRSEHAPLEIHRADLIAVY